MSRDLEIASTEQARQLFGLCSLYIDGSYNKDEKADLLKQIVGTFNNWRVDFKGLYDEITANLDEPMSDRQRERYCFSLITPFEAFSKTLYPKWLISKSQEDINNLQGVDGVDKMVSIFEKQIEEASRRANSYWRLGYSVDGLTTGDEAKSVFFELAQIIKNYGNMLDAAFVVNGLDLNRLQEICNVRVKQFVGGDCVIPVRALQIKDYIGSEALAEEYIRRLQQEQPEPQQGEQEQQPQQGEQEQQNEKGKEIPTLKNTDKERLVFGNALMKQYMSLDKDKYKWHKPYNLLAYMCGRLYCGDRVIDIDLKKGYRQMPRTAVKELFSGIDVANNRYSMKEPPTDYWIIDDLFKDKGGVSR